MINPHRNILGFELALCEDHEGQWTETPSRTECSVCFIEDRERESYPKMVTLRVKDVIDALVGGSGNRPLWLSDFQDDPVSITADLHEVLVAYRAMKRAA